MRTYGYEAITPNGVKIKATIEATTIEEAERKIASRGLILSSKVRDTEKSLLGILGNFGGIFSSVKPQELILFTKQFRTMFRVGVPILQALAVLQEQTENKKLKKTVELMQADIKAGVPLSTAFKRHPKIFNPLYCSMVEAGESSGKLPEVMDRLIDIISHDHKVRKDIQSAMTYPTIVFCALIAAFFILLTVVIPQFSTMFARNNAALPWTTQVCISLNAFLQQWWQILVPISLGVIIGLIAWIRTPTGRFYKDTFILYLPIIGFVLRKAAMSRFASIFAILQASGVNVLNSIDILAGTIGNEAIAKEFRTLKEKLQQGTGISTPLKQSKYFTPMVVNMIAIGEETGQLDEMLTETSIHYDYEVSYAINRMTELLGPTLIICMAGLIGFFALAVFLPMWEMGNAMGL